MSSSSSQSEAVPVHDQHRQGQTAPDPHHAQESKGFGHHRVRELQLQLQLDSSSSHGNAPSPLLSTISPRHPHPDHTFPLASPTPLSPLGHTFTYGHANHRSASPGQSHSMQSHTTTATTVRKSVASSILPSLPPSPNLKFGSLATTASSVLTEAAHDHHPEQQYQVEPESILVAAAAAAAATLERLERQQPIIPTPAPPPLARSSSTPLALNKYDANVIGHPLPLSPRALSTPSSPTHPSQALPVVVPTTTIHHPPARSASHRRDQMERHFYHTFPLSASAPVSPSASPAPSPVPLMSPSALTDYSSALPPPSSVSAIPETEIQRAADAARAASSPSTHQHPNRKHSFAHVGTPFANADELSTIGSASLAPSTLSHAHTAPPCASHSTSTTVKTESSSLPKWRDLVSQVATHRAKGNQLFQAGEYEQAAVAYGVAAREFELVAFAQYHPESPAATSLGSGGSAETSLKTMGSANSLKAGTAPRLAKRASVMNFGSMLTSWLPSSGGPGSGSGGPGGSLPRNSASSIRRQPPPGLARAASADSGNVQQDWSHAFTPLSETTLAGVSALATIKPTTSSSSTVTRLFSDWIPYGSASTTPPSQHHLHPTLDPLLLPPAPSALPPTLHVIPTLSPFPPLPLSTLPRSVRRDAAHVYANRSAAYTKLALRHPISPCNPLARRALLDADRAVQLDPDWAKAHFRRADALILLDRPAAAKSALATVTSLDPGATKSSGLQARRERATWAVDDARAGLKIVQLAAGRDYCVSGTVPKWSLVKHLLHVYARQMRNCMYIVADEAAGTCVVVDPAWDPDALIAEIQARGWSLAGVVIGHAHVDHVGGRPPPPFDRWRVQVPGLRALVKAACKAKLNAHGLPVPVYMHPAEAPILAMADAGFAGDPKLHAVRRMCPTPDGFSLRVGRAVVLEFWHTPGHTPGSQMVIVNGNRILSSDTVFAGAVGRCDLPGGDAHVMKRTLSRLRARLPEKAVIFPGHAYGPMATTVEREKRAGGALDPMVWEVLLSEMGLGGCDGHGHEEASHSDQQGQRVVSAAVGAGMRRSSLDA
ncbi:hypothetical protein BCR44DRAFT_46992 [Catenaria anguillulae PL171]|uniref:Metallo-beta-lactamase domain-containing protein n=1 Tax=Catenaria anguillulae PL171 TaxID=765915 RepID=A0A1Y2HM23_9FUNG|nr:hypothetical protein BCR44DRAFT_46992 [Catenaria anguillulae PL171]